MYAAASVSSNPSGILLELHIFRERESRLHFVDHVHLVDLVSRPSSSQVVQQLNDQAHNLRSAYWTISEIKASEEMIKEFVHLPRRLLVITPFQNYQHNGINI